MMLRTTCDYIRYDKRNSRSSNIGYAALGSTMLFVSNAFARTLFQNYRILEAICWVPCYLVIGDSGSISLFGQCIYVICI